MTLRRRELLQGLGTIGLVGGCRRGEAPPPVVSFVGQSPERGHAIRDAALRKAAPSERIDTRVVIVGGGVAGMSAAWRLHRAGMTDFRVVELEAEPGGTARAGRTPRSAYPMGAHYLPSPHPSFGAVRTLLQDLGMILGHHQGRPEYDPSMVCAAPVERHRYLGMWAEGVYPAVGQTADEEAQWHRWLAHLVELDQRRGSDGRRLFDLPLQRSSVDLRHLDRISASQYLDELGLHSWRLRWTVEYACRDDYGCGLDHTSAFAALHHYLCRGLEARHDRVLLTWPEGNARLVDAMAERAEVADKLLPSTAATFIDPDSGVVTAHDLEGGRVLELHADMVLWAAPRFVLPHVLPRGRDPLPRGALTYAPWLVANVEVTRAPQGVGAPLSWDNVSIEHDHLGYVVANHLQSLTDTRPGAVLTFYEPRAASSAVELEARRGELLAATAGELGDHVIASLEGMHPGIAATISRVDIARWGHAMVRPTPGSLFSESNRLAAAAIGRVLPCAADVGGLPLFEQAFYGAVLASEEALSRLGRPSDTIVQGHVG